MRGHKITIYDIVRMTAISGVANRVLVLVLVLTGTRINGHGVRLNYAGVHES